MSAQPEARQRTVTLPAAVTAEERQRILDCLRPLETIETIDIDNRRCRIRYRYPAITFAYIWLRLRAEISTPFSLFDRIRHNLAGIMEENERDYRLHPCGWHYCVQNIHAARFDASHTGSSSNRKQQWQQYSSRKRETTSKNTTAESGTRI